ncbi:hypothetical protein ACGFX4_33500 [Kitasatospora sp. NPDC048365]|uniref:hypothetical protein n=1 Tax=Kitasatospora sp. NPDC048365 TaxID=3364050 RepID=UPI00371C3386
MPDAVPLGDRPLDDCLEDFWRGGFTLRADPGNDVRLSAVPDLDPSGITVRGRDLAVLLAPAYRDLTGRR